MNYTLRVSNTFKRQLRRFARRDKERILTLISEIQDDPYSFKPLSGQLSGTRSARTGELRVIYAVDESDKRVILLYVGHRERVYEH